MGCESEGQIWCEKEIMGCESEGQIVRGDNGMCVRGSDSARRR